MKIQQLVDSNAEATIAFHLQDIEALGDIFHRATDTRDVFRRVYGVVSILSSAFQGYLQSKSLPLPSSTDVSSLWAVLREHLCFAHEGTIEGLQPYFKDFANAARGIGDELSRVYDLDSNAAIENPLPGTNKDYALTLFVAVFESNAYALLCLLVHMCEEPIPF